MDPWRHRRRHDSHRPTWARDGELLPARALHERRVGDVLADGVSRQRVQAHVQVGSDGRQRLIALDSVHTCAGRVRAPRQRSRGSTRGRQGLTAAAVQAPCLRRTARSRVAARAGAQGGTLRRRRLRDGAPRGPPKAERQDAADRVCEATHSVRCLVRRSRETRARVAHHAPVVACGSCDGNACVRCTVVLQRCARRQHSAGCCLGGPPHTPPPTRPTRVHHARGRAKDKHPLYTQRDKQPEQAGTSACSKWWSAAHPFPLLHRRRTERHHATRRQGHYPRAQYSSSKQGSEAQSRHLTRRLRRWATPCRACGPPARIAAPRAPRGCRQSSL